MRKLNLSAVALLISAALTACGGEPPAPAPTETPNTGPDAPPGIALSDARVQLPVVAGRPGVAYVTVTQGSGAPRSIAAVSVSGAGRSEMHETREENGVSRMNRIEQVPLGPGRTVKFEPGGAHVMLFDLDPALKAGGTAELTVTFDNGDKATTSAAVTKAGMDMAEHGH